MDETTWPGGSGAGTINTLHYWPKGKDYIVALAAFEDKLIVFGKQAILIYSSPSVIASLALSDTIVGTGCIARDSVQHIGSDIIFLSESGIRSLRKSLITSKSPVDELSLSIRDLLNLYISAGTLSKTRSAYNAKEGFYLLSIVGSSTTTSFYFDVKNFVSSQQFQNSDGSSSNAVPVRTSIWTGFPVHALAYGRNGTLYASFRDGSNEVVASYAGYYDGNAQAYSIKYASPWIDLADPTGSGESGSFWKIPKQANVITVGSGTYQVTTTLAFDFDSASSSQTVNVSSSTQLSEWGLAEWGLDEWNAQSKVLKQSKFQIGRYGQHMRIGLSIPVMGYEISVQKIDLFMKRGRSSI